MARREGAAADGGLLLHAGVRWEMLLGVQPGEEFRVALMEAQKVSSLAVNCQLQADSVF